MASNRENVTARFSGAQLGKLAALSTLGATRHRGGGVVILPPEAVHSMPVGSYGTERQPFSRRLPS